MSRIELIVKKNLSRKDAWAIAEKNLEEKGEIGCQTVYVGLVKPEINGHKVLELRIVSKNEELYEVMRKAAEKALKMDGIESIKIAHSTGELRPGDIVLVIAAGGKNRHVCFEAAYEALEVLKNDSLVIKKEFREDGVFLIRGGSRTPVEETP